MAMAVLLALGSVVAAAVAAGSAVVVMGSVGGSGGGGGGGGDLVVERIRRVGRCARSPPGFVSLSPTAPPS